MRTKIFPLQHAIINNMFGSGCFSCPRIVTFLFFGVHILTEAMCIFGTCIYFALLNVFLFQLSLLMLEFCSEYMIILGINRVFQWITGTVWFFILCSVEVRSSCLFCRWNCWPSVFKLSFHNYSFKCWSKLRDGQAVYLFIQTRYPKVPQIHVTRCFLHKQMILYFMS